MVRAADHDGLGQNRGWVPAEALVTPEVQLPWRGYRCRRLYSLRGARAQAPDLTLHASDNRVELERAKMSKMALAGKKWLSSRLVIPVCSQWLRLFLKPWKAAHGMALFEIEVLPVSRQCLPPQPVSEHRWDMILCDQSQRQPQTLMVIEKRSGSRQKLVLPWAYNPRSKARPEGFARVLLFCARPLGQMCLSFCPCSQHQKKNITM